MEFTVFVNLSEQEVARLIELLILVTGAILVLLLLARPLVLRYARGRDAVPSPGPLVTNAIEEEPPQAAGLVKVSVWVPEANANHVQLLARELRDGGPLARAMEKPEKVEKPARPEGRR